MSLRHQSISVLLDFLGLTRLHRVAMDRTRGLGAILMLHHVRPTSAFTFGPNAGLEITPEFLEQTILAARRLGFDFVSLDEAYRRITAASEAPPFVCYTLDDGYADNLQHALPVFERHEVPFAIYVATALPDGCFDPWWVTLEEVVLDARSLDMSPLNLPPEVETSTARQKHRAFSRAYWRLRSMPEAEGRAIVCAWSEQTGTTETASAGVEGLSWGDLRALQKHPLVTIGAHTANHYALSGLSEESARREIADGLARHEAELGSIPRHFAYPYGDAGSAGSREAEIARRFEFLTATTTRKGMLTRSAIRNPLMLPRLSINGHYQSIRQFEVLLSGLPFALAGLASRVANAPTGPRSAGGGDESAGNRPIGPADPAGSSRTPR